VVDGVTGRPIGGALVRLGGTFAGPITAPAAGAAPAPALTNVQGQFLFRNLAPGRYPLTTQRGGYLPGSYGQTRPEGPPGSVRLGEAERITDVTIRMWRYAAITGKVLDEAGEPAVGVMVRSLRRGVVAGRNQWTFFGGTSSTDDRGIYRLGSLSPGEYLVVTTAGLATVPASISESYVQAMQSGTLTTLRPAIQEALSSPLGAGARIGDLQVQPFRSTMPPPSALEKGLTYATVFHPSVTRMADATRLRVGPGEEKTGVDLQQRLVRMYRIAGRVLGPDGQPMSAGLTLVPSDAGDLSLDVGFEAASAVAGADGRFTFLGVPEGHYLIRMLRVPRPQPGFAGVFTTISTGSGGGISISSGLAADGPPPLPPDEPTLWADVPVNVADHVDDVLVGVRPGARVGGTVVFDGPGTPLEPQQRRQMAFSLVPMSGRMGGPRQPAPGRLVDEDSFVTSQYPPGKYFVNVSVGPPWSARSVSVGGRNALEEPIDLGASDINGLVVTLSSRRTEFTGTVRDANGTRPHATVLVFPADHKTWIANGMRATRARSVATAADGSFQISGLLPGTYLAVAVAPQVAVDLQEAATVEALARAGVLVTLTEGATQSLSLRVTPAP
jgi:hypothetical protein